MLTRVLLAVLLCGMAAGLAMGAMQHFRLTPLILQAETFETAEGGHSHAATEPGATATQPEVAHDHGDAEEWGPQDGTERTLFTFAASILASAGFAALLAGAALTTGKTITRKSGWLWGLCGFIAVSLAPAAGLAPELPGMPAADLFSRQAWWLFTIAATASALWLLAFRRESWAVALALALVIIPHIIGAPQPTEHESGVPAALASQFVGTSLAANAMMWLLIGILLGYFLPKAETAGAQ
jgi:cobalt transporter subunit CbtA